MKTKSCSFLRKILFNYHSWLPAYVLTSILQLDKLAAENSSLLSSLLPPRTEAASQPGINTVGTNTGLSNGGTAGTVSGSGNGGTEAAPFAGDETSQGTLGGGDDEATNDTAVSTGASNVAVDCTGCGQLARDPVRCSDCPKAGHARCMELPEHMREAIRR